MTTNQLAALELRREKYVRMRRLIERMVEVIDYHFYFSEPPILLTRTEADLKSLLDEGIAILATMGENKEKSKGEEDMNIELQIRATAGTTLGRSILEAMAIAFKENRDAKLIFNNKEYEICITDLMDKVESTGRSICEEES